MFGWRWRQSAGAALVIAVLLTGCSPAASPVSRPSAPAQVATAAPSPTATPKPTPTPTPIPAAGSSVTFVAVIDGDTVETSAGRVRLIGIDTPERGECGHPQASLAIERLVSAGDEVAIVLPPGQNDTDRYDRLLRYVITSDGIDLGLMQLEAGNALARFDSRDGYPAHPQEDAYHAAQLATRGASGNVVTTTCASAAPPVVAPPAEGSWWTQYSSCTRLKKNTVGHPTGPFSRDDPAHAAIYDWFVYGTGHNGDGDFDGLACE